MTQPNFKTKLPNSSSESASEARQQAEAYDSLFADIQLELNDGTTMSIPPHPEYGMLDDDRMEAYEDLQFEIESFDRDPDIIIPEHPILDKDGKPTGEIAPAETLRGNLLRPFRKTNADGVTERVKPAHSIRVVQAALGDAEYKRLRDGGHSAADVWRIWGKQGMEIRLRRGRPQADGSPVDLETVPVPDSE